MCIRDSCWLVNYVNIDPEQTVFDLTVYAGQSYYFVISSYPSPQNIAYSLDISENSCVPPVYTAEVVANCSGGEGDYSVDFDVSEIGSFNDFNLSDGTSTISVQEAGIYTFGPYNSGDSVSFTVETGDVNCDSSVDFTYTCPPTGAACVDPLLIDSLPYNTSDCLLYTSPSPRDATLSRMPSSA